MKRKRPPAHTTEDLRDRAERFLAEAGPDREKIPVEDVQRLVYELQVHQTELDMQNQELRRAQETIEEARSRYEALYDLAPVGYFTLSRKGKIIQVNLTGAGLLGVKRSLLIYQPFHLRLAPEFRKAFRAHLQMVFETGGQQTCELKILRHDGTHLHVLMESTTQPEAKEAQRQCHSVLSDITDHNQAEEAIKEFGRVQSDLLDKLNEAQHVASIGSWEWNLQTNNVWWSDETYRIFGVTPQDFVPNFEANGKFIHPDDFARYGNSFEHALQTGEPLDLYCRLITNDGVLKHANTKGKVIYDDSGRPIRFIGTIIDVTERKRAEEDLNKWAHIFKHAHWGVVVGSADGKTMEIMNPGFAKMHGYTVGELIGRPILDIVAPESWPEVVGIMSRLRQTDHYTLEAKNICKDGTIFPVQAIVTVIRNDHGEVLYHAVNIQDITVLKRMEEKLRSAAQEWRSTFDAMGDAVCLMDSEYKILTCNQVMADLVGRPFPEIIGRHCWEVVHSSAGPIDDCPLERMKKSGKRETLTLPFGDRWLHAVVNPMLNEAGEVTGAVYSIMDITEHRRAQEQIKHLNVILSAINDLNETLLRAKTEPELFQHICNLMLEIPYNRFTWIGLVEPGSFEVKPVAWAGHEEGYLSVIKVTWDDSPHGRGPIGTAIKTGQFCIAEDIENDPNLSPWRQQMQQRGYASCIAFPLIHNGNTLGALVVYADKKNAFRAEELGFLKQVAGNIAVGVRSLRQQQELVQGVIKFQIMMHQTVETIASIVETRDTYTAGHQKGVAQLAGAIATEMGLDADRLQGLRVAGLLHDIGKMLVPIEILSKPAKLSEREFNLIKAHPQAGADFLGKINFPWPVAQIVLQHHERLDGSGYPNGLADPNIIEEAKILAVADVVEAMVYHRPYRPALGVDKALKEIKQNQGTLYDPEVVDVCVKLFTEKGFKFD